MITLLEGDVRAQLQRLPAESVHCVVTSVPYWGLRSYGTEPQVWGGDRSCAHDWQPHDSHRLNRWGGTEKMSAKQASNRGSRAMVEAAAAGPAGHFCTRCGAWSGELGLEPEVDLFVEHMVEVFQGVRRVLRRDGTVFLNIGDCYAGTPNGWAAEKYRNRGVDDRTFRDKPFATTGGTLKPKDLCLVPQRVALALQADGWYVRADIIWHKPNPLPESIRDRPTKSHEYVWMLAKSEDYFYDAEAVREPVTGKARPRGSGVNPKAEHIPSGWDKGPGTHTSIHRSPRSRQNADFSAAVTQLVSARNRRSVWTIRQPASGRVLRIPRRKPGQPDVWRIATQPFPGAHFATFPQKLVEPCILAGTSAHGCCSICGAPWERVKEPTPAYAALMGTNTGADADRYGAGYRKHSPAVTAEYVTTGWQPTCDCNPLMAGDVAPATVLDPFLGSGTTLLVADRLGRSGIGIELQPDYLAIARERLGVNKDSGGPATAPRDAGEPVSAATIIPVAEGALL